MFFVEPAPRGPYCPTLIVCIAPFPVHDPPPARRPYSSKRGRFMTDRLLRRRPAAMALLLLAAAAAAGSALAETPELDAALARAAAENKPLVIDFYTDW
jgi:hypothetical protein